MDSLVAKASAVLLFDEDIARLTRGRCRIVRYADLARYSNLIDAAGPHRACICLFEKEHNKGHWVAWFEVSDGVWEWFDSYGFRPDDELQMVSEQALQETKQIPAITKLISTAPDNVKMIYNQMNLQKLAPGIETCGRWCAVRIRKRRLTLAQFQELFHENGDYLVTLLTML